MVSNDVNANSNEAQVLPESFQIEERENIQEEEKRLLNITKIIIIFCRIIIFILIVAIIVVLIFVKKQPPKKPLYPPYPPQPILPLEPILSFIFPTRVGEFNMIKITQKYNEISFKEGKKITTSFNRKEKYDIMVLSENEPIVELKYYYTKLYTCVISIVSECISQINNDCNPLNILILSELEINLNEVDNIEDLAIPLCLFNITYNNVITSIKCPKSLNEGKVIEIILDLYFYRPPALKIIDKENNNITINKKNLEDGKVLIRETNGGKCGDIFNSFCTTDINTTKDSEGNLISCKEKAITNITLDENNNYLIIKESTLIDITEKNNTKKGEIYRKNMEQLIEKLNPYMHYYELVSDEQFNEI